MHTDALAASDIIVWMLVARAILTFAAGFLMLKEPMMCGGRNKPLHRLLAVVLFVSTSTSLTRAFSRAEQIVHAGSYIPAGSFVVSETIALVAIIALVGKLGYDYVKWSAYQKVGIESKICGVFTVENKETPQRRATD